MSEQKKIIAVDVNNAKVIAIDADNAESVNNPELIVVDVNNAKNIEALISSLTVASYLPEFSITPKDVEKIVKELNNIKDSIPTKDK